MQWLQKFGLTVLMLFSLFSAKKDKERYAQQMAHYKAPEKQANYKRNKTGYNMFFTAHVLRLKQTENGVPSERGSVARLVGTAWKALSAEDKEYYEREADKHNGWHPINKDGEGDDDDIMKRQQQQQLEQYHQHLHHGSPSVAHGDLHPPMHHPGMVHPQHDPRHHPYYAAHPHMYGPPPPHSPYGPYDYSQHHPQHQGRYAGPGRHPFE